MFKLSTLVGVDGSVTNILSSTFYFSSRKKRGHKPTGVLVHAAKATGFNSVSEMLHMKGPGNSDHDKNVENMGVSPKKKDAPNKVRLCDCSVVLYYILFALAFGCLVGCPCVISC